mmetsp:Transcript_29986/g.77376  ORF Transcript_29986/g.77376 Transcript_29986/m.77376 type:complete len:276 (-) Transcript_29986:590-1417(-)
MVSTCTRLSSSSLLEVRAVVGRGGASVVCPPPASSENSSKKLSFMERVATSRGEECMTLRFVLSAPLFKRRWTTCFAPLRIAMCKGVSPADDVVFTSAPCRMALYTPSMSPSAASFNNPSLLYFAACSSISSFFTLCEHHMHVSKWREQKLTCSSKLSFGIAFWQCGHDLVFSGVRSDTSDEWPRCAPLGDDGGDAPSFTSTSALSLLFNDGNISSRLPREALRRSVLAVCTSFSCPPLPPRCDDFVLQLSSSPVCSDSIICTESFLPFCLFIAS